MIAFKVLISFMKKFVKNKVAALIPAAGESSRMKTPKPFLKFDKERVFIEKIVDEFIAFGCQEIAVIVNEKIYQECSKLIQKKSPSIKIILNDRLDLERFYSIKLGLISLTNSDFCFIQNCDNPFINQEILQAIYKDKSLENYIQPTYKSRGGHPILLPKFISTKISQSKENDSNFKDILSHFPTKKVELDFENILLNINTNAEYQRISKFLNLN